jgi:SIR2-like domain
MHFPDDLLWGLERNTVHLFVGSGASTAANLTTWSSLIDEMRDTLRSEYTGAVPDELDAFLKGADNLDVADLFRDTVQTPRYLRFLRRHYRREVPLSKVHTALAQFPVKTVFTTNYDKLLETAFRKGAGCDPAVILFAEQLGYIDTSELRIIKLHGDIDHPNTIVLTRKDYAVYAPRHQDFIRMLEESLNNYTVLFVGCSLQDPNFRHIYQEARGTYDTTKNVAYALMRGTNEPFRKLWRQDGLTVLPVTSYDDIPLYLEGLLAEVK